VVDERTFRVNRRELPGRTVLEIAGTIDEHADLTMLGNPSGVVEVDMRGVKRINSYGVRAWIDTIRRVPTDVTLVFTHCPPLVIDQMNMVDGLLGHGRLASFYAPMVCPACEHECLEFVDVATCATAEGTLPHVRCGECGALMQLDDIEDKFTYLLSLNTSA